MRFRGQRCKLFNELASFCPILFNPLNKNHLPPPFICPLNTKKADANMHRPFVYICVTSYFSHPPSALILHPSSLSPQPSALKPQPSHLSLQPSHLSPLPSYLLHQTSIIYNLSSTRMPSSLFSLPSSPFTLHFSLLI